MPFYLTQAKLSKDAIQAMMAKPQDRTGPVGKLLEAVGGSCTTIFSPSASTMSSCCMRPRTTSAPRHHC